jgi:hypothetical protein
MAALMIHPRDIHDEETYYVVNKRRGIVTFHSGSIHGDENYNWEAPGHPSGNDRMAVPGSIVKLRSFQVALAKGLLEFESADSYYDSIQAQADTEWAEDSEVIDNIDRSAQDGFEVLSCLGPAPKGSGQSSCGEQVIVRASALPTHPPLCDRHGRFAAYVTYEPATGWTRIKG